MTDWLSVMERGLKAVRFGIFQASDNLAMLLDGFCRAPEGQAESYSYTYCGAQCPDWDTEVTCLKPRGHMFSHQCYETFWPLDSAASPQVAVVAPSPKQGSDSGPADSDIPPSSPAGPPQTSANQLAKRAAEVIDQHYPEDRWDRITCHDYIGCACGFRFEAVSVWARHVAHQLHPQK